MSRSNFFVVIFDSKETGTPVVCSTFERIRNARKMAVKLREHFDNVRIMKGGPGGMEVQ